MSEIQASLDISADEASSLSDYIRRKNTAVLTVMFTDIQGFTEVTEVKGEEYSSALRKHHDAILTTAIEKDGSGLVLKFIGDAVMAVFSEPSAAVSAALAIQDELGRFNADHPELEDLLVRIGMHMGQVAVEDNLQPDVFGRHVNRAARIESLASGGHIYMSDPVFDSARGWLGGHDHLQWTLHGSYYLKGIDKPVDIYEVCDGRIQQPRAPGNARKKRVVPRLGVALALVALGIAIAIGGYMFRSTEVWLSRPHPEDLRLDDAGRVALDGKAGDEQRKVLTALAPGRHVLHYDVARGVRFYAAIEVGRGENIIKPQYRESRLPSMAVRSGVRESPSNEASRTRAFEFQHMGANGEWQSERGELVVSIRSRRDEDDADTAHHVFDWRIMRGGKLFKEGRVEATHRISAPSSVRVRPVVIARESPFFFFYQYYTLKAFAEFTLGSYFDDYISSE